MGKLEARPTLSRILGLSMTFASSAASHDAASSSLSRVTSALSCKPSNQLQNHIDFLQTSSRVNMTTSDADAPATTRPTPQGSMWKDLHAIHASTGRSPQSPPPRGPAPTPNKCQEGSEGSTRESARTH